ncbi:MAG TPA: DNA polymerase I [Clostridia bacterium]|nr:DNA polymerase I [Clostridia bacterium]
MDKKKMIIIDGNSLMYRAFYGIRALTTSKGVFTNAVFGFTNMLLNLIEQYHPDYIGVAFDLKGPTFRHEIYEDYKANRQKTPEELLPQFPLLKTLLKAMNIAVYEMEGFEADDILGTFSRLAQNQDFHAYLVTGDRDAMQLVSHDATVLLNRRGTTDMHIFDPKEVEKVYGLRPDQMIDFKALMGDSSDNIPGVPGVGEKTALKLLSQYPTLDLVLDNVDQISGKRLKENLTLYREQAFLSKELATIITDVPIDFNLEDCCYDMPKSAELKGILEELEFTSIINKLDLDDQGPSLEVLERVKETIEVKTLDGLQARVAKGLNKGRIAFIFDDDAITFSWDKRQVYYVKLFRDMLDGGLDYYEVLKALEPILKAREIGKIVHDGKKLLLEASKLNIELNNLSFDTFIAAYLLDPTHTRYDVKYLLHEYLGIEVDIVDAADLLLLAHDLKKRLEEVGMDDLYNEVEHPLIQVLADMELAGFKVNGEILRELDVEFTAILEGLTKSIYEIAGQEFNINSPKQLGEILFEKLGLPIVKRTKTGYSTNIEVLEQLKDQHEIIGEIMEYRQVMKLKSTYVDGLLNVIDPKDGRIHSSFNQTITATGRISSTEPNLQNIPVRMEMGRRIRRVFVPSDEDHVLLDADYSQIELRVLAHISKDPTFIHGFENNQDIHRRTAAEVLGIPLEEVTSEQRNDAKAVNFGIVYGISDFGLARNLGISRNKARLYIESYLKRHPGIKEYMDNVVEKGKEQGYIKTLMGRRRNLPELSSRNYNIRSFGERIAMNTPIQGTAADIIKKAMNDVYYELKSRGLRSKLVLQVHDELIIDAYRPELEEVKEILRDKMENAMELSVPLIVDIGVGSSWYDVK